MPRAAREVDEYALVRKEDDQEIFYFMVGGEPYPVVSDVRIRPVPPTSTTPVGGGA